MTRNILAETTGRRTASDIEDPLITRISNETGIMTLTEHRIFPGIELIYNDVHLQTCQTEKPGDRNILEINHCLEGRIEHEISGEFLYLSEGDLSICLRSDRGHISYYPISRYHGVTISIDLDTAPQCVACFLQDVNVEPAQLAGKFCSENRFFIMRANPQLEHIFSELYSVPESIKKGYLKVKVLELLLFLSAIDTSEADHARHSYASTQVILAKKVCAYLCSNMDSRMTIDELSEKFHASPTQIKNSFKGVYGMSIYAFTRTQKMRAAALDLKNTDSTVLEIAGRYGYDNASKFAKAFRDCIGMTPVEYRNSAFSPEQVGPENGVFWDQD